jgi:hypothetical protein
MMLQHLDSTKFYRVKAVFLDLETDFDAKRLNQKRDQKRIKKSRQLTLNQTILIFFDKE